MPFGAGAGYGKVVKIQYKAGGIETVTRQQRAYNAQLGKMGIVTTKLAGDQKYLSQTWTAQKGMLAGLGKQLFGAGLALMAVHKAQQMVIQAIRDGIREFREFDIRIAEVSTILDEVSMQTLPSLERGIVNLSKSYGKSAADLSKGMYDILSAAFAARDSMLLLNTATKAAIAGLSDVRTSVDIFTTVLRTYGKSAEQAIVVSDQLFQSVIRGKFQFRDLESALGYVVPIAAQAGIRFDELMAALSTATRHGLHLDMTARGLALAIQNIVSPTEKAQKAAFKYGIDMSALGLKTKGLQGWFEDLHAATKRFGSTVIAELIPNMRSLRVAMVLAGDEGLEGMLEDFGLLQEAGGRTNEALGKIMETHQFMANQIQQEMSDIERSFGEWWSGVDIAFRKGIVNIANALDPLRGEVDEFEKSLPLIPPSEIEQAKLYVDVVKLQEDAVAKLHDANKRLKTLNDAVVTGLEAEAIERRNVAQEVEYLNQVVERYSNLLDELSEPYSRVIGQTHDMVEEMDRLRTVQNDLMIDMEELSTKTIPDITNRQIPLLETERELARASEDIKMALADENYQYEHLSPAMQEHVNIMRNYEKVQRSAREEQERYNIAIRENNLEIMKLQLRGMMRRRGLSRQEEKRLKGLRIANLQARIDMEEDVEQLSLTQYDSYKLAERAVNSYVSNLQHEVFRLRDTYDMDLQNLSDLLQMKEEKYDDDVEAYGKTTGAIEALAVKHYITMRRLWEEGLIPTEELPTMPFQYLTMPPQFRKMLEIWSPTGLQRGSYFVPKTAPYMLHRGETVGPAGRGGGNVFNISVPINVGGIRSDLDIQSVARKMGRAITAELLKIKFEDSEGHDINLSGLSNYGIR